LSDPTSTSHYRSSKSQRDETEARLHAAFAEGRLTSDERDSRVAQIQDTSTSGELDALVADLPPAQPVAPAALPVFSGAASTQSQTQWHIRLLGGFKPRGQWLVPANTFVITLMGSVDADFRQARFLSAETTLTTVSLMGSMNITVPPGVRVEISGLRLLGSRDEHYDSPPSPAERVVRARSFSLLGSMSVHN